jgi:hypothetical protein
VEASNKAKTWTIVSAVVGVVLVVIVIAASAGTSTEVTFNP